jgi:dihydrofolate reductase
MIVSIIVAVADNGVIGRQGDLPWRLRTDLRRFKALTMGHTVIAGRTTHESIVSRLGGPLPGRRTIVVSRNPDYAAAGCEVVMSLEEAFGKAAGETEVFIIGGAELYAAALSRADRIYLTTVHAQPDGDAFFPHWERSPWRQVSRETHPRGPGDDSNSTYEVLERMAFQITAAVTP